MVHVRVDAVWSGAVDKERDDGLGRDIQENQQDLLRTGCGMWG